MLFDLIIFDYDGVLVDSLDEVISASRDFCRSIRHDHTLDKKTITALDPMTYAELARSMGLSAGHMAPFSRFVFSRLQASADAIPFFPGIEALLRHQASAKIAIISGNSREVIAAKLSAHALDRQVDRIFGAYEPGDKADKIRRACAEFKSAPGRTCMIGDSVSDLRYAQQAGVQSVAVTWGWQSRDTLVRERPDFIVERVSELTALLG